MVKLEAPPYAPLIVLGGALATIWGAMQKPGGGNTSTVTIDTDANAVEVVATVTLVGLAPQTGSSVTFNGVPFGTYTLNVTASGYSDYTQSLVVNAPLLAVGVNLSTFTPPAAVALSNGAATARSISFTSTVTNATGTVGISYVYSVHNAAGQPVAAATVPESEANGTYALSFPLSTALTSGQTYTVILFPTDTTTGSSLGSTLQYTATIGGGGGGGLTALHVTAGARSPSTEVIHVTTTPSTFSGTIHILNAAGQTLALAPVTNGAGNGTVTRQAAAQVVHANSGTINSNTLTVPATTGGGGLQLLALTGGTLTATHLGFTVAATPITFSGSVSIRDSANAHVSTVRVTNGKGTGTVPRTAAARVIHANSGTVNSNALTVPPLGASTPRVVFSQESATGVSITFTRTVTHAPTPQPGGQLFAVAHDSTGAAVTSATQTGVTFVNGTMTQTFSWNASISTPGTYQAVLLAVDAAGGEIGISSFSFTVSGGGGGGLAVLINGALGTSQKVTMTYVVSGAAAFPGSLMVLRATVHNALGQTVGTFSHNVQHPDGSFTDDIFYGTTLTAGNYSADVFAWDFSGTSISGLLTIHFTV